MLFINPGSKSFQEEKQGNWGRPSSTREKSSLEKSSRKRKSIGREPKTGEKTFSTASTKCSKKEKLLLLLTCVLVKLFYN